MSIWNRMRDITVATFNERLDQAQDPVRMIDQYLSDLKNQLQESERLHNQCMQHASNVRQQYLTALDTKEKREKQAVVALKAGEEQLARIVLQEKLQAEEQSEQYRKIYEDTLKSISDLEVQLGQLRTDYNEVAGKRGYYLARMEAARLQQRMSDRMTGISGSAAPRLFDRLENFISDIEIQARTLREVRMEDYHNRAGQGYNNYGSGVPSSQAAVDEELEQLRRKLNQEGTNL
jgi:phage shock protein A